VRFLPLCLVALAACSSPTKEICGNGIDDDMNGVADCNDTSCALDPACQTMDAAYYGTCGKCGQSCTKQLECFGMNLLDDRPLPQCKSSRCEQLNSVVQLRIEYNTSAWTGAMPNSLGVITTRWIKKTAQDGSAVTCATVNAASTAASMPLQLEQSGKFALMGLDITRVSTVGGIPNPVTVPFAYTSAVSDYLIFSEAWSGGIDSSTRLPTGARQSTGCVETGAEVAPITVSQTCTADAGTSCRTLRIPLPAP
jgi:hypothetical protein